MSVSRITDSAPVVFSTTLSRFLIACSRRFWTAPSAERCVDTLCNAFATLVLILLIEILIGYHTGYLFAIRVVAFLHGLIALGVIAV